MPNRFYAILADLPEGHFLRTTRLGAIHAEVRHLESKVWRPVATWKIKNTSFEGLGSVWKEHNQFRAPVQLLGTDYDGID